MKQPQLQIGILQSNQIHFEFSSDYITDNERSKPFCGSQKISLKNGKIKLNNKELAAHTLVFRPVYAHATFMLHKVKIGIGFHWEQNENQIFKGSLIFKIIDNELWAINEISTEDYITSVITSEMNVNAPKEFIKAHAVISRSWALAQLKSVQATPNKNGWVDTETERVIWYDKQNHTGFDLCADDHCQRYQGLSRITNNKAENAIKATFGKVLTYNNEVCDARFSKCCGGASEDFENVWQPTHFPYLTAVWDDKENKGTPDLSLDAHFSDWLKSPNPAFCNTHDPEILSSVLNHYDQSTTKFFRWKEQYSSHELAALIQEKSGIDFGEILDLIPLERGKSGRIIRLKICGTKQNMIIGKELEIRRFLSKSHLLSSAFTCKKETQNDQTYFLLEGAGWGHGVGLCQIGAAVMSFKEYTYMEILEHFFKGAKTTQLYGQ